ncbi:hypothetical protein RHGRI_027083 [Rhododendron griersonianum]|uniref:Uncharacterized protein n=1 Tax=Rhododendron griersonianum TaxID=479676 RepID=A0AAV6IXG3_9ERIC|nr:hypothetical protein RHGRI_027083 [Rhododendron griersonianum]
MTASGSEAGFELLAILPSPETLKHDVSGLKRAKTAEYPLAFFFKSVPNVYVFGDSIVDCGPKSYHATGLKTGYLPYGTECLFTDKSRFTNGHTIPEYISSALDVFPPRSMDEINIHAERGIIYASASSGILPETGTALGAPTDTEGPRQKRQKGVRLPKIGFSAEEWLTPLGQDYIFEPAGPGFNAHLQIREPTEEEISRRNIPRPSIPTKSTNPARGRGADKQQQQQKKQKLSDDVPPPSASKTAPSETR